MKDLYSFQSQEIVEIRKTLSLDSTQLLDATSATRKHLRQLIPLHQMSLSFFYSLIFSLSILC